MSDTTISPPTFSIKTEVFEGPLDLLLDLVEKRKLLINDISLAAVTDEYMQHVAAMQELSLPGTANFVALAATLLLVKSKSLLPVLELTDEEEATIDDLEKRLRLYQIYRNAAVVITDSFGTHIAHERQYGTNATPLFHPDSFCTTTELQDAMYRVMKELPVAEVKPKVQVKKVISLEEMMSRLQARIEQQIKLSFKELVGDEKEKTNVIVGFLAVLESVKQGTILVAQLQRFSDIDIESISTHTPRYY